MDAIQQMDGSSAPPTRDIFSSVTGFLSKGIDLYGEYQQLKNQNPKAVVPQTLQPPTQGNPDATQAKIAVVEPEILIPERPSAQSANQFLSKYGAVIAMGSMAILGVAVIALLAGRINRRR